MKHTIFKILRMSKKYSNFAAQNQDNGMKRIIIAGLWLLALVPVWADNVLNGSAISGDGWKGLDLGEAHVITTVGWNPSASSGSKSVLLGIFEGANRSDFMDALPLTIIADESQVNQMNYADVACSRGFRYVRYVAPSGMHNKMPSVSFYGHAGAGNSSCFAQLTNIPTVTIHTLNNQVPYDKEHEIEAYISVISDFGHTLLSDDATIRERGNYSRGFPKKPYRIKFANKHHVLGAPANARKWTLINNYGDKTLMRNQLAFELSRRLGMPYTPFCAYVDVILNGEYKGCYQLCDQIEVRKNRVDVAEMSTTDNSGEALTGGYLIEADAYADGESSMFWSSKWTGVTIKYPKEDSITSAQAAYIEAQYNKVETNWQTNLDLNTFLRHFLVGELSGNTDTYWSMYFYKQRSNDTMYVGPVWDFDLAFDNDNRTYPVNNKTDYIYRSGGSTTGYLKTLVNKIVINNTSAKKQLAETWAKARLAGLTGEYMTHYIDEQEQMLEQSQRLNFIRWPIMNEYVHQNPRIWGSYEAEVENVRSFMVKRIQWMDNKLGFDASILDVQNHAATPAADKILQDGQLLIIKDGKTYTPTGIRVR